MTLGQTSTFYAPGSLLLGWIVSLPVSATPSVRLQQGPLSVDRNGEINWFWVIWLRSKEWKLYCPTPLKYPLEGRSLWELRLKQVDKHCHQSNAVSDWSREWSASLNWMKRAPLFLRLRTLPEIQYLEVLCKVDPSVNERMWRPWHCLGSFQKKWTHILLGNQEIGEREIPGNRLVLLRCCDEEMFNFQPAACL